MPRIESYIIKIILMVIYYIGKIYNYYFLIYNLSVNNKKIIIIIYYI